MIWLTLAAALASAPGEAAESEPIPPEVTASSEAAATAPSEATAAEAEAAFLEGVRLQVEVGDHAGAAARYEAACGGGHMMACSNLASQLERGLGVRRDALRAADLHRRACDADLALSCDALGTLTTNGVGVPADDAAAVALYRRACTLGSGAGCAHLAVMYDGGFGVERSWPEAKAAYGAACDAGHADSCWTLGRKLLGIKRLEVLDEAVACTVRACELEVSEACAVSASIFDAGELVDRDRDRARQYAEQACGLGHAPSCAALR